MNCEPPRLEMLLTKLAFVFFGKPVYKAFADRLPVRGGERVLDFGCGMGTVAYYAAKRLPRGHLTCLDISERWLSLCRKILGSPENVAFLKGNPEFPLLEDEVFDLVYCHFVLHDVSADALEKVVPALARSLKAGGTLVFREPLRETEKLGRIKRLIEQNHLFLVDSRVTDVPLMGNALESVYKKPPGDAP